MPRSESYTETLVRKLMCIEDGEMEDCVVCPQGDVDEYPLADQLLKKAGGKPIDCSLDDYQTRGRGKAKPEYVIFIKNRPNLVIVVECKSNVKKHESDERNHPRAYAVDGALYYAKYLKEEFNVIAIAVSGTKTNAYKSDAFYWRKDSSSFETFDKAHDVVLTPANYVRLVEGEGIRSKWNLEQIRETALQMNESLRSIKMTEKVKPIFIAGILIGLSDQTFADEYTNYTTYTSVSDNLLQAIKRQLIVSDIPAYKREEVIKSFDSIKGNQKLSAIPLGKRNSITWYIRELDMKIKPMMAYSDSTVDALSVFYQEFVRRTGGDGKGLGIVLTPQHLTHFMAELADVSKSDCVLDICCGSGSFLLTSMGKMLESATPDEVDEIRKQRLYGIELDQDIYVLSIANMIVRGDGKSNIVNGDCFDHGTLNRLHGRLHQVNLQRSQMGKSSLSFSVGLLNPPYSQKDVGELEFVEQLLNLINRGGKVCCVVPTSCALGAKQQDVRERLMKKHRLEAVFSMPDDIFSPTAVNVCVMVWTAHTPHDPERSTFFGYCKDDGFVKAKKLGRIDKLSRWAAIEQRWLHLYREREVCLGESSKACVTDTSEWVCEAYMETDYAVLSKADFEQTVADFLAYKVRNRRIGFESQFELNHNEALDVSEWEWFDVGGENGLFSIKSGTRLTKEDMMNGLTNYLGAISSNNGVRELIGQDPLFNGNTITVNYNGSVGEAFYQEEPYWPSDDVKTWVPNGWELNKYTALFICTVIKLERFKFNYGRKFDAELMEKTRIKLPATAEGVPDYEYMENYIKSCHYSNYI